MQTNARTAWKLAWGESRRRHREWLWGSRAIPFVADLALTRLAERCRNYRAAMDPLIERRLDRIKDRYSVPGELSPSARELVSQAEVVAWRSLFPARSVERSYTESVRELRRVSPAHQREMAIDRALGELRMAGGQR